MKKFLLISLIVVLALSVLAVSGVAIAYASITKNAVIQSNLLPSSTVNTAFLDKNEDSIKNAMDNFVEYDEIPKSLINAVVALEDKRYYKHSGVDYIRILGAVKNNIANNGIVEGGSTITQQLIKNTHLSSDKTIKRKFIEIKLARQLEKQYSKNDIITMYLNVVYFGNGMYGAKAAAKGLFNKNVSELTLSESATLAAILKNPSKNSPINHIDNATERRNLVLNLMYEQGFISESEKTQAVNSTIEIDRSATYSNTQSYCLSASYEAASILNISVQTLLSSNYKINTYLDASKQDALTDVIGNPDYYALNDNGVRGEGLGVILDNDTLGVSAYFSTKRRNIFDFYRPYGSIIKPILIYAPAFEYGLLTTATPILDEKTDFSGYSPKNYGDKYLGWINTRTAIETSSNVAAVKTYNMLGFDRISAFADKINVSLNSNDNNATLALGNLSSNNNYLNILGGYAALANGGYYTRPTFIKSICDADGNVIYENSAEKLGVMNQDNAYLLTDMLISNATEGTAKGLNDIGFQVAAKTGTVGTESGNTDAYNVGYTSKNTYLIWHGNSTGLSENDLSNTELGGSYATRSARDILSKINTEPPLPFVKPSGIIKLTLDKYSLDTDHVLLLATENTPNAYKTEEIFGAANCPTIFSERFDNFGVTGVNYNVTDGNVNLTFEAEQYLYYEIYRKVFGREVLIKEFTPQTDKTLKYTDTDASSKLFVKYVIKPHFINDDNKKVYGNSYYTANLLAVKNNPYYFDY